MGVLFNNSRYKKMCHFVHLKCVYPCVILTIMWISSCIRMHKCMYISGFKKRHYHEILLNRIGVIRKENRISQKISHQLVKEQ